MKQNRGNTNHLDLTIEAVCEKTGISRSTVYQYLRNGLLHAPVKIAPKQLRYNQSHLQRLGKIRHMREKEKLPLKKIKEVLQPLEPDETDTNTSMEDQRLQMINQAAKIFSKKGFFNTTISDITDALKIGKGTFYGYFESKEDLYLQSIKRLPEVVIPKHSWDEINRENDYFQKTYKRACAMLESFSTFSGISSIAKLGLRSADETMAKKARNAFQSLTRPLVKELRTAIQEGIVRDLDVDATAFLMYSFAEAMGYWLQMHPEYLIKGTADIGLDILFNGMISIRADNRQKRASAELKDKNGTAIRLMRISIEDTPVLCGYMGEGELRIDLAMISAIRIHQKENKTLALVTMKTGEKINLEVPASMVISGDSSFGSYRIPLCEVETIEFSTDATDEWPSQGSES